MRNRETIFSRSIIMNNDVIKSLLEKANDDVATGVIIGDILAGANCVRSIKKEICDLKQKQDHNAKIRLQSDDSIRSAWSLFDCPDKNSKEDRKLKIKIFAKHICKTAALVAIGRCVSSCVNNFVEAAITKLGDNSSSNS